LSFSLEKFITQSRKERKGLMGCHSGKKVTSSDQFKNRIFLIIHIIFNSLRLCVFA